MNDDKTVGHDLSGAAPDPKKRADELRGLSPDVLAQAREAGTVARSLQTEKGSVALQKKDWEPASRDQHKALAEIGQPPTGRSNLGSGPEPVPITEQQQTPEVAQTKEAVAKGTEKSTEVKAQSRETLSPAELATRFRGRAEQTQPSVSEKSLGELRPGQTPAAKAQSQNRAGRGRSDDGPTR